MSSRTWQNRIQDILKSISGIQQRTAGKSLTEIQRDEILTKAILYDFMVIGEAARNIPAEIQSRYPTIPWRVMGDMRNIVAHEYFQIDLETIWETIQQDLPRLIPQLQTLLNLKKED
jgi:uncharacterized protein with HEPN domain